jgi:hypothetical protein
MSGRLRAEFAGSVYFAGSGVPRALAVPVASVVGFAVEEVVVVAATSIPVWTPMRVEELPRTPVVIGQRTRGLGLDDAGRSQTGQAEARGADQCRRSDAFDIHVPCRTTWLGPLNDSSWRVCW